MIVVLVPKVGAPHVLNITSEHLILLARDADAAVPHTCSVPAGVFASEFDQAWAVLTKDMLHAQRFDSVNEALCFYGTARHPLSVRHTGSVMAMLKRLPPTAPSAEGEISDGPSR